MTKTELTSKWGQVLDILTQSMERLKVDNYFRPLSPVRINEKDGTILLHTIVGNSSFYQNMISRNRDALSSAVVRVFGKDYRFSVTDKIPVDEETAETDNLDPKYTFDTFVAGNNSRLAYAASLAVAEGYDKKYNPLFLYGSSGLGKTHLMHAIGHYVKQNRPKKKVLYVSSETFTNELILAIQNKSQQEFKKKYRNVDYLLFDDVQFIAGKKSTEDELFATFDALYAANKQIVFTSDKPPRELGDIPERLISRFSWGIIADIQTPDYETRMAILKNKAILEDLDISDPELTASLEMIAQSIQSNIRELESAFTRVLTFSTLTEQPITKDFVRTVLSEVYDTRSSEITPDIIKKCVADYFGVKVSDIEGESHARNVAYPRQIAIYLVRDLTNYSFPKMGEIFGGRDHSTVLYSYKKIEKEIKKVPELQKTVENIKRLL
ncbi:MAG: chromosomal replication initiator protein DnaA [Firmicutes bacterium]|nr:chromosomal replication initiator protein DnaA [Bacillota bacterium]